MGIVLGILAVFHIIVADIDFLDFRHFLCDRSDMVYGIFCYQQKRKRRIELFIFNILHGWFA